MTELLRKYIEAECENERAYKIAWEKLDTSEIDRICKIKWDKQDPLLAQMSPADLQYVLDNYIKSPQAKYEFVKKYFSKENSDNETVATALKYA